MTRLMKKVTAIVAGATFLSGCMSANYYTEQGTPITEDTIALFNSSARDPIIPYSKGKAKYDAFPWVSEQMQQRMEADPRYSGTDELEIAASSWLHDDALPPLDITITRHKPAVTAGQLGSVVVTTVGCIFSLCLVPLVAPQQLDTTIDMHVDGELIYSERAQYKGTVFMSWFPLGKIRGTQETTDAVWYASFLSHEEKLTRQVYDEQPLYDRLKSSADVDALIAGLGDPALRFYRPLVSRHLAAVLAKQPRQQRLKAYAEIVEAQPDFVADIQGNERLLFVGPEEQRVVDVLKQTYRKRSAPAVAASIRAAGKPYALFTQEQTRWLTSEGLPADVVAAMIEVSEPPSSPAVAASPAALADATPGGGGMASGQGQPQPAGLQATAAECAKAYGARKVCENMPGDPFGLLMRGCMAQVKKKFGGLGCDIPF